MKVSLLRFALLISCMAALLGGLSAKEPPPRRTNVLSELANTGLTIGSPQASVQEVAIPYTLPKEYDVELAYTRSAEGHPAGDTIIKLPINGKVYPYCIRGRSNGTTTYGFWELGAHGLNESKLAATLHHSTVGKKDSAVLKVRTDSFEMHLHGEPVLKLDSLERVVPSQSDGNEIGFVLFNNRTTFHSFIIVEVGPTKRSGK